MRGWSVPRKAGWDTHGLPVEVEVEKELRIHGKAAIEEYGVEPFIKKCIESVFRYTKEWEDLTERVAFWVDMADAYVTYHRSYVESVWWALSELQKKGLLYRGHKVVWWWAQGGTALSSGEVGQGYKTVDDPSVYVAFPVVGEDNLALLVWTTTPWTLPSNMYAAVRPGRATTSSPAAKDGKRFVVAKGLLEALSKKLGGLEVESERSGASLVGLTYRPPFELFRGEARDFEDVVWRVIAADFVTLDAGTGIVHIAPAFGEDDHEAHRRLMRERPALPLFCAVKPDGTFIERFERYAGRWVKDCDKEIQHDLNDRGLLVHAEMVRHDYPFCWRADSDPLIQYARPAWYVRTTAYKDKAIENSRAVDWLPEHIKEGRFGDFLKNNVDWALSRERWWGTPLNVGICDRDAEHRLAPPSVADIEERNPHAFDHFHRARRADPGLSEHLLVHKPWIDYVTVPCAACGGTMRRVPEVIDCWFDSGCMPFAQWGYPHAAGSKETFAEELPRGLHQRGHRPDARMVLLAADDLHAGLRRAAAASLQDMRGPGARQRQGRQEREQACGRQLHAARDRPRRREDGSTSPSSTRASVTAARGRPASAGVARSIIALEDFEGMDLTEGQRVRAWHDRRPNADRRTVVLTGAQKGLPRRIAVMHEADRATLGVIPTSRKDVKPVEVPWLDHGAARHA